MQARTWILVSDASRARLFEQDGRKVRELGGYVHLESARHVRDLVSDQPGRRGSHHRDRPGLGSAVHPKEHEAQRFAHQHADMLKAGLDAHRYEELILVAPPHFLGLLRKSLDDQVSRRLTGSRDRDYLQLEGRALIRRLGTGH